MRIEKNVEVEKNNCKAFEQKLTSNTIKIKNKKWNESKINKIKSNLIKAN